MSPLVICEISRQILQQQIQMQLSKKEITFSQFFGPFPKSKSISEQFEKKGDPPS